MTDDNKIESYNLGSVHIDVWPMEDRPDKYLVVCYDGEYELKLAIGKEEFTNYRKLTNKSILKEFRRQKEGED